MADAADQFEVLLLAGRIELRGSSAYSLRLAEGLPAVQMTGSIATPDASLIDPADRLRFAVREYPQIEAPLWGCLMRRFLWRETQKLAPRLIHIQSFSMWNVGRWLAKKLRLPYVATFHEHPDPGIRWAPDEGCRKLIAVSESVAEAIMQQVPYSSSLVSVIPPGVPSEYPHGLRLPLEPGHVPVIGAASPLEPTKGLLYFLGAARQVLNVRSHVEFLVAGAGPEESRLRRVARELNMTEKVTFVPHLRSLTDALAAIDIFCLPSLQQGLGSIMLEAMAMGRPVIASNVGGVSRVIRSGENGLLTRPMDCDELARHMLNLLDQPARARALGNQARKDVLANYRAEQMVVETAQVYRNAIHAC
jgi:glycosyltransferase involved in cell wall biosynthesis